MRWDRLPLTYVECRSRFQWACAEAGWAVTSHPIAVRGPTGEELAVDVTAVGAERPRRALVAMSGVHGVEGYVGSALQTALVGRLDPTDVPADTALLLVHAVNPWGMAWWRRQNEHNVDLNRNWRRSETTPEHNDPYDAVHALACPDTPELPDVAGLFAATRALVDEHGLPWVRDAITTGQYRHPDGLHFGGDWTEESTAIVERVVRDRLAGVQRMLTIDLHTGHGPFGEVTLLSDQPIGSAQDRFLRAHFGNDRVEATADNPDATTGVKRGQIANGLGDVLPDATCYATSVEFGTVSDNAQLAATYHEQWVHRRARVYEPGAPPLRPEHAAAVRAYRACFCPDDPEWERRAITDGGALLDAAVQAVARWDR